MGTTSSSAGLWASCLPSRSRCLCWRSPTGSARLRRRKATDAGACRNLIVGDVALGYGLHTQPCPTPGLKSCCRLKTNPLALARGHRERLLTSAVRFPEPEDRLRRAEAGDLEFADRLQARRALNGEIAGRDDGAAELARDLFQPRREIDGGADAGEIQ